MPCTPSSRGGLLANPNHLDPHGARAFCYGPRATVSDGPHEPSSRCRSRDREARNFLCFFLGVWLFTAACVCEKNAGCFPAGYLRCSIPRVNARNDLINKRPDLSGRPPCKGAAIGVASGGARVGGQRTLHIPPRGAQPTTSQPNRRTARRIARRRSSARARVRALLSYLSELQEEKEKRPAKKWGSDIGLENVGLVRVRGTTY